MSSKAKITIELPTELKAELIEQAEREGINLSILCRRVLKLRGLIGAQGAAVVSGHAGRIEAQALADAHAEGLAGPEAHVRTA